MTTWLQVIRGEEGGGGECSLGVVTVLRKSLSFLHCSNLGFRMKYLFCFVAVVEAVNEQLTEGKAGRLFAVVYLMGKQVLVKTEDLIVVEGYWAPQLGEVIRLEKVNSPLPLCVYLTI